MAEPKKVSTDGGGHEEKGAAATAAPAPGLETLSAAEYSRRVHQWLWDSYCGYLSWQTSCLAALMAGAATFLDHMDTDKSEWDIEDDNCISNRFACLDRFKLYSCLTVSGVVLLTIVSSCMLLDMCKAEHLSTTCFQVVYCALKCIILNYYFFNIGREYIIPSLAHRFIAEMVDFFILFFIKATIVLSIMHLSGIKDISKFAMHYIIEEIDEDTSMEDLQKMVIVALIYRLLVCFYEIICIWGAGGATPGKFLLGLRVVTCDTSVLIAPSRVLVIPSSNVSMTTSTIRALIKNFSIASFFPAFITLLFFQHNRTAYDIVAGTIVVKRNSIR
nr:protein FAM8A1 [Pogona vitticeps]